jgi:uncharacterized protein YbjQ (UPF0145 family)
MTPVRIAGFAPRRVRLRTDRRETVESGVTSANLLCAALVRYRKMETLEDARKKILKELTSDDADVRADYLKHFESDIENFSEAMAHAVVNWQSLHADVKDDENLGQISAWVISAITLHILSMKVFVSGHTVAAGNLFRQVVETIALAARGESQIFTRCSESVRSGNLES